MPQNHIQSLSQDDILYSVKGWLSSIAYAIIAYFINNIDVILFFLGSVALHCILGGLSVYKYKKDEYVFKKNILKFFHNTFTAFLALLFAVVVAIFYKLTNKSIDMFDTVSLWSIKALLVLTLVYVVRSLRNFYRLRTGIELPEFDAISLLVASTVKGSENFFKLIGKKIATKGGCEIETKKLDDEDSDSSRS